MDKEIETVNLTVKVSPELREALKVRCASTGQKMGFVMVEALTQYLGSELIPMPAKAMRAKQSSRASPMPQPSDNGNGQQVQKIAGQLKSKSQKKK